MKAYTVEEHKTEHDWLTARLTGIGSSDAAAVVGLGRDRGCYSVWAEKTSPLRKSDQFDELIYWGHALEDAIAERFMRDADTKAKLINPGEYTIYRRTDKPWHCCTPDRVLERGLMCSVPLEIKTAHYDQARIWGKEVPWNYVVQCQWQIHVMDADCGYIAVLCNGRDFAWHPVERNEEIIRRLVKKVDQFWNNHVVPKVAPPVDATKSASQWLGHIYDEPHSDVIELGEEFHGIGTRYDKLCKVASKIDKHKLLIQNRIKEAMGNCELGRLHDDSGFQWKSRANSDTRTFTRKKKVSLPDE